MLQHLLAHDDHRIVAVSGTSGGAICALLAWYGLRRSGRAEAVRLLEGFAGALDGTIEREFCTVPGFSNQRDREIEHRRYLTPPTID